MEVIDKLLQTLKNKFPSAEKDGFSYSKVDTALVIQIKGGDVHPEVRSNEVGGNKEHIDLTYGSSLPQGSSPVDDFFPTVLVPQNLPLSPHMTLKCRIWGECLSSPVCDWVPDELDLQRFVRNEGRNPSLQLRGVRDLRITISEGGYLVFLHLANQISYEAFSLTEAEWTIQGKNLYHKTMVSRPRYKYEDLVGDMTTSLPGSSVFLPKPFLLLAGISGTGKSRFVKKQAEGDEGCYELVPVRPDWHEPSDLLGYVSRINTDRYVVTPFLKFLVKAWKNSFSTFENGVLSLNLDMKTYWLCLDEMNLAPVEQYFADYLSVLETREWKKGVYTSEPLIRPATLEEDVIRTLREGLDLDEKDPLWLYFMEKGIQLAPNLVVAGTVNMDETTHGFSRKVIDRAYTIDFGDFFPNHFDQFFTQQTRPKKLGYSCYSSVDQSETLSLADPEGKQSIQFLSEVNEVFKDTAYQLAFRALNELLVTVKCFSPADDAHLKAVWDDFLMAKLLPRVEGDLQKIGQGDTSLLKKLGKVLTTKGFDGSRPDLLSESVSGGEVDTGFRSTRKIDWMQKRLDDNGFTSFWP